jgi:hypothetical protein
LQRPSQVEEPVAQLCLGRTPRFQLVRALVGALVVLLRGEDELVARRRRALLREQERRRCRVLEGQEGVALVQYQFGSLRTGKNEN